jgi:protein-tyrosine kinase
MALFRRSAVTSGHPGRNGAGSGGPAPVPLEDYVVLLKSIQAALPEQRGRIVELISSQAGEGVSTVCHGLASAAATVGNEKVLVCYLYLDDVPLISLGIDRPSATLADVAMGRASLEHALVTAPSAPYAVCALSTPNEANSIATNLEILSPTLKQLRLQFDLIVLDALPANMSILGGAMARYVDGVILVIEAGRARLPSLISARDLIEVNGGKLLGAILNKRRFYIPRYIYRNL